jgi:hypothetical protein
MALVSEDIYPARAWLVHRFSGTASRSWGFFWPKLAPHGPGKPALGCFEEFS